MFFLNVLLISFTNSTLILLLLIYSLNMQGYKYAPDLSNGFIYIYYFLILYYSIEIIFLQNQLQ